MKTIINRVLVITLITNLALSSAGIVSAQGINVDDFGGSFGGGETTVSPYTQFGNEGGYGFVDYNINQPVTQNDFGGVQFTNPGVYYGTTDCIGCNSSDSGLGYGFVDYNINQPVTQNDFGGVNFINSGTYYGTTDCIGCGSSYTTPVTTNSTYYSPVSYGSTNYGSVNYGTTNYGQVTYGSSWTGVTTGCTYNCGTTINTTCPSGTTLVNGTCQVTTVTCPAGSTRVNNTCVYNTTTCPTGTTLINGTCQVNTTTCPAGTTLVNGACQVNTTTCPSGTHLVNGTCVANTITCPAGTTLVNGTCQANTTTCPVGSTLVNGTCQINTTTCPANSTLINGVCQAPITCPAGTTYTNGACQGTWTLVCPSGSTLVNNVCQINTTSCPSGSTLINGICQINTTACPAGTTLINGVCQVNTTQCPAGTYLQNGVCTYQTTSYTCPNGQVVSNLYACPITYGQTSYVNTSYTHQTVYQTCWDNSVIPNTSVCPAQYKVCANGTSIPINQVCYVAPTPAYVAPPVIKFNNVITSPVTQITNNSARCNGIGLIAQGAQSTGWFEYGQTANLGRSTSQVIIGSAATSPFSNVLSGLQPSTSYYCRAVMQNQYGIVKGEIVSFTTKGTASVYVAPAPVKKTVTKTVTKKNQVICSDGSTVTVGSQSSATMLNQGQKLIALQLEKVTGDLTVGGTVAYRLSFKNLSDTALTGVVIKITVPTEISVTNVPAGSYDAASHMITLSNLSLAPNSENVLDWTGTVEKNAPIGKTIVTTAYVLYTVPGTQVQDEVTAYTASSIMKAPDVGTLSGGKTVVGTGHTFLPQTLVEWLALIAILVILFILGRSIASSYKKSSDSHH